MNIYLYLPKSIYIISIYVYLDMYLPICIYISLYLPISIYTSLCL